MLNSLTIRLLWHSYNWLTRLVIVFFATVAVLLACTIIALRYWILPDIERYHDYITTSISASVGNPVTIGKIVGDWRGIMPYLDFSDVQFLDDQRQVALMLKRVRGSVSWMSLLTAQLRLANLELDRPELLVRRDASGNMFVGGVKFSRTGGSNDLSDVLLRQSRVVVRDATIVWVDDLRKAPALVLQNVNLRIESLFNHHRFSLRAFPPPVLASPLDVRGDFYGSSFDDMSGWSGTIYTQLDFTDLKAWQSWLDMPRQFSLGRGALRGWLDIEAGKFSGITADVALQDVVVKLGDDVPEMEMVNINGRVSWHELHGGFEVTTNGLALRLKKGIELPPTDLYLRNAIAANGQPEGEVRANTLQLEKIAGLTKFLPIEPGLREQLNMYEPKGKVSNLEARWQGSLVEPSKYKIDGHFENIAINQVGKMPGFSGLTFNVDGNEAGGRLNIKSRQMIVDAPGIMREPLSFTALIGQAGWKREHGELSINVDNIAVANDDLAGNLYGSYQTKAGTRGILNLTGKLTRGDIRRAARYTPLIALSKNGNDWLHDALQAGHTEDFRIRIKGNLSDFPLDGTKDVLFEIEGHARDAVLEFDKSWPSIEKISGEFLIRGNRLEVRSPSAIMAGARLQNVTVTLPDMMSKDLSLDIKGEAQATSNTFLEFIQNSPVRGYIDGFTDGMDASGNGHLNLFLRIPLQGDQPVKVSGAFKVQNNDIDLGKGVPKLRNTSGVLSFTESGMQANGITSEILGGPANINMQTTEGRAVHITVKGRNNMDILRNYQPSPLLNYLHGSAAWDADISVGKKSEKIVVNSNLFGISSSLPQPFSKNADEEMTLHVEKNPAMKLPERTKKAKPCPEPCPKVQAIVVEGQDVITARLGSIFSATLSRRDNGGVMAVESGVINFGSEDKLAEPNKTRKIFQGKSGVWLIGTLPVLSIQGWEGLMGGEHSSVPDIPIAGIKLHIDKLTGYDQDINAMQIEASQRGDGLALQLSSSALDGEVIWEPHGYEEGGMIRARLNNLQWSGKKPPVQDSLTVEPPFPTLPENAETDGIKPRTQMIPGNLPALNVRVENLQFKGKKVGHFEMVGHPEDKDWRLRRLNIANPDGSLVGDGVWSDQGSQKSQINLTLDINDSGKMLARYGYPNTVMGGSGKLLAKLSWDGSPADFDLAKLNGTLKLDTGKGRFLKMDPGAGKLLSVLSLQALPKNIFEFKELFGEGFQFDSINGNASIKDGMIDTQDFQIAGSSAKVTMKGKVDLNKETQDLQLKVLPTLGNTVSLIGVFAVNPAVGIGSLIANKVLGEPLDKLVSFEYNVSGTWSDPNVVKIKRAAAQPKQDNPSE